MTRRHWLIVLRPNGVVDRVDGGAPSTWVGREIVSSSTVPASIRRVARALLAREEPGATDIALADDAADAPTDVILLVTSGIPLRATSTRVDELAARVLDAFASQASGAGIELTVTTSPRVPQAVCVDREKIVWAIASLVGNALRYVSQGEAGQPRVRVEIDSDESPAAPLIVRVRDNGPGIDPDKARWLFERDPRTGQTAGVALLMIADVMTAHRGTVTVGPGREGGTVFTLRIPDRQTRDAASTTPNRAVSKARSRTRE